MVAGEGVVTEGGNGIREARVLAAALAGAAGGSVDAILLYGSHLLGARPDRHSALDFVVVVRDYGSFYRALHDAGEIRRPAGLMTWLAGILPPNVIAYTPMEGAAGIAKCLVVSRAHLEEALGPRPPDHFLLARLIQRVALVWAADDEAAAWLEERLAGARAAVLAWVAPFVEGPFDADSLGRTLLDVCYRGELRPEARDRSDTVFEAQRDHFVDTLEPVLEAATADGTLVRSAEGYRFAAPASAGQRRRWRRYFARSKARATARWPKHVVTFDNWLPYIHRKVERRTGRRFELTRLERRWPVVFLWPRVLRVLFTRPEREDPS